MSSSDTTRILVLGAARLFEPANGYQLRRELLSWQIETWANVNPGSIYSMLTTLTKQGMLDRADLVHHEGARPVAVYSTTEAGRRELLQLIRSGLTRVLPFDQTTVYAALSLMVPFFTRQDVIGLLTERVASLTVSADQTREKVRILEETGSAPPHVAPLVGMAAVLGDAEAAWVQSFIERLRAGEMIFSGESGMNEWKPLANDPGWEMVAEQAAYLAQLRRTDIKSQRPGQ